MNAVLINRREDLERIGKTVGGLANQLASKLALAYQVVTLLERLVSRFGRGIEAKHRAHVEHAMAALEIRTGGNAREILGSPAVVLMKLPLQSLHVRRAHRANCGYHVIHEESTDQVITVGDARRAARRIAG